MYVLLTYISLFLQDAAQITLAPVLNTSQRQHEHYHWIRINLEKLGQRHAEIEWIDRNTFSELLEQIQRAENLSKSTMPSQMQSIQLSIDMVPLSSRSGSLIRGKLEQNCLDFIRRKCYNSSRDIDGIRLFLDRPRLEANYCRNYSVRALPAQFSPP